jgi:hypothetical protein
VLDFLVVKTVVEKLLSNLCGDTGFGLRVHCYNGFKLYGDYWNIGEKIDFYG